MSAESLRKYPQAQGRGGDLRDKYPGFFLEVAGLAGYIEGTVFSPEQTYEGNEELLDALLEDIKTLIIIDPDMRR